MPLFVRTIDDATVLVNQASSPGTGWTTVASVQAAVDKARTDNRPLYVRPGIYDTQQVVVTAGTGGGNKCSIYATPGSVTFRLQSGSFAQNLFFVSGISDVRLSGLIFDGNNVAFTGINAESALVRFENSQRFLIEQCEFVRSVRVGTLVRNGSVGTIQNSQFSLCSFAVWSIDSLVNVSKNRIFNCQNNGVAIWRTNIENDGSLVEGNNISNIQSGSGTGANGNGITVFKAVGVRSIGNFISDCAYSSVRYFGGGSLVVANNYCWNSREVAIFIESPGTGSGRADTIGGSITGNIIAECADGIKVVNLAQGGDGIARRVTITGNQVAQVRKRQINDPGYVPTISNAVGIQVEGACVVSSNIVEGAEGVGIVAGTNLATEDLNVTGNLVTFSPIGIGYSNAGGAGQVMITGNQVRGATNGSVVPVTLVGAGPFQRVGTSEFGNVPDQQVGNLLVGHNRTY